MTVPRHHLNPRSVIGLGAMDVLDRCRELLAIAYRTGPAPIGDAVSDAVLLTLGRTQAQEKADAALAALRQDFAAWADVAAAEQADVVRSLPRGSKQHLESIVVLAHWGAGLTALPADDRRVVGRLGRADELDLPVDDAPGLTATERACLRKTRVSLPVGGVAARPPIPDPHARRVLERLLGRPPGGPTDHASWRELAPKSRWAELHQGLARLGRDKCTARTPRCQDCVLISFCPPGQQNLEPDSRPVAVECFGGAGGLAHGFTTAGFRIAVSIEMERHAAQTHRANHPGTVVLERDATQTNAEHIRSVAPWLGDVAAVIGGPPCQGYSIAGKRDPNDGKNQLYRAQIDLARGLSARFVVIENVPGMKGVGGISFVESVHEHLSASGYISTERVVRASDYGVPQLRRRIIFFAQKLNNGAPPPVPQGEFCGSLHDPCTCGRKKVPTVEQRLAGLPLLKPGRVLEFAEHFDGFAPDVPGAPLLNASTMDHGPAVVAKIAKIKPGTGPISYRRLHKGLARTIVAGHRALPVHPSLHRTISVREAARIQGFRDDYVFCGPRGRQPLQVANAVPPPLAARLALAIQAELQGTERILAEPLESLCGPVATVIPLCAREGASGQSSRAEAVG